MRKKTSDPEKYNAGEYRNTNNTKIITNIKRRRAVLVFYRLPVTDRQVVRCSKFNMSFEHIQILFIKSSNMGKTRE